MKYRRLKELGIDSIKIEETQSIASTIFLKHTFIKLDLADKDQMGALFKREKFDAVCNLAAQEGVRYSLENPHTYVQGFINILEGCRENGIKNLSYPSNSSVYGLNKEQPFKNSDQVNRPISIYAASKKNNELMAHTHSQIFGISTTGLRFFTVYDPWGIPDI